MCGQGLELGRRRKTSWPAGNVRELRHCSQETRAGGKAFIIAVCQCGLAGEGRNKTFSIEVIMARQFTLDQVFALLLLPLVLALLAVLYLVVVPLQGRPFIFASRRMRGMDQTFSLLKIRTMHPMDEVADQSALGGDQKWRVTRIGGLLRRTRLDELPQILNVLRGDIRFIGPRPPLAKYVALYPELYARVLADTPPGITGLATVILHAREERLLSACRSPEETDRCYRARCIPIKARLDLIYRRRRGWALNLMILWLTFARLFPLAPVRRSKMPMPSVKSAGNSDALCPDSMLIREPVFRDAA